MIKGWEDQTRELTNRERKIISLVIDRLKTTTQRTPQTNEKLCRSLKSKGVSIEPVRMRKIINYIRTKNLLPRLLSTSKGYYLSNDKKDVERYIESLEQRAKAILLVAGSLRRQKI